MDAKQRKLGLIFYAVLGMFFLGIGVLFMFPISDIVHPHAEPTVTPQISQDAKVITYITPTPYISIDTLPAIYGYELGMIPNSSFTSYRANGTGSMYPLEEHPATVEDVRFNGNQIVTVANDFDPTHRRLMGKPSTAVYLNFYDKAVISYITDDLFLSLPAIKNAAQGCSDTASQIVKAIWAAHNYADSVHVTRAEDDSGFSHTFSVMGVSTGTIQTVTTPKGEEIFLDEVLLYSEKENRLFRAWLPINTTLTFSDGQQQTISREEVFEIYGKIRLVRGRGYFDLDEQGNPVVDCAKLPVEKNGDLAVAQCQLGQSNHQQAALFVDFLNRKSVPPEFIISSAATYEGVNAGYWVFEAGDLLYGIDDIDQCK